MERKFTDLSANPFEDNIVFEPREAEPGVSGLNELPLRRLLDQFALLEAEPPPRRRPLRLKAQLVTSAEPGYGKSHLIGRLFKALEHCATLVYLRPFQDARSSWRSVLLKLAQELHRPGGAAASPAPDAPTQLDALAAGVFSGLMLKLIERGKICDPDGDWAAQMRRDPLKTLGFDATGAERGLANWLREQLSEGPLLAALERELAEAGVKLQAPAGAWLRVLFAYGAGGQHGPERAAALQWLRGEGVAEDEAEFIGLRPNEMGTAADSSASGRNEDAWNRVQDLCALAGYYRPFLFCFDQTELFTGEPALAAEFGVMAELLVNFGLNHMAVVTTNLSPWRDNILPHIQTALRARFSAPLELEGINAEQARALARRRLEDCGLGAGEINKFFDPPWFEDYFRDAPTESVRRFLDRCAKRCAQIGGGPQAHPLPNMEEYFQRGLKGFESKDAPLDFDPDLLQWAVGPEAMGDALESVIAERFDDPMGLARVRWRRPLPPPERQILFGFENDSRWQRWNRILEQIADYVLEREAQGVRVRYVFLRTPEQKELPPKTWPKIGVKFKAVVANGSMTVPTVNRTQLALLHAAHELYMHVLEGNTPFGREEMLAFVRGKLAGWWESFIRQSPRSAPRAAKAPNGSF
jgi:hypothetical protein